jgi:hypothetical protein
MNAITAFCALSAKGFSRPSAFKQLNQAPVQVFFMPGRAFALPPCGFLIKI